MKIAFFVKRRLSSNPQIGILRERLTAGGISVYMLTSAVESGTDAIACFGGDGTFLSASALAASSGVPLFGVNLGRVGFLSGNTVDEVADGLLNGGFSIESRELLQVSVSGSDEQLSFPPALNEVSITRAVFEIVGVEVSIDGNPLPTYWADGLLVATSSGSTAYNMSAGGPVCLPTAEVFVISPIAPHNLGVRPIVIPSTSVVELGFRSRSGKALLSMDNRSVLIHEGTKIRLEQAPVKLQRMIFGQSNFMDALKTRFFWGQDVRNNNE